MSKKCPSIVGNNPEIVKIKEMISKLSRSSKAVLLKGEKGTGKELIAKVIQHKSDRKENPFVKVNCSALTNEMSENELLGRNAQAINDLNQGKNGIFSVADTGTLFFDEIGQLPPAYQAELLLLEKNGNSQTVAKIEQRINVRVIASTSDDLESLVKSGTFLKKLYDRLNAISIIIPPLRYRLEDIPFLSDFFTFFFTDFFPQDLYIKILFFLILVFSHTTNNFLFSIKIRLLLYQPNHFLRSWDLQWSSA